MGDDKSWGEQEFLGCAVEDQREAKSLSAMADKLLANPELSFSAAVGEALRKTAWRIFSKEEVDLASGHYRQTAKRCEAYPLVFVSQDTTEISYPSHYASEGLGNLGGGGKQSNLGLCLHSAMAISEQGLPLGLVGQKVWAPVVSGRKQHHSYPLEDKESYRWVEALQWVNQYLAKSEQVVIISDRESDFYEYLSHPRAANTQLLLRAHFLNRTVEHEGKLQPLKAVTFKEKTTVTLLLPKGKRRKARTATLTVSWGRITCPAAQHKKGPSITLWVIKAEEVSSVEQREHLEWVLLTTITVEDEQTALKMLDYYRKRWIIERWHLVLKQGMQVERLQFDNFIRLANAIQLQAIVAWQLLCLKHFAADSPEAAASQLLDPVQVEVLEKQTRKKDLTIAQALTAVAAFAGFVPSKKQPLPGEKTLWRGWFIFEKLCQGYQLASQNNYETG